MPDTGTRLFYDFGEFRLDPQQRLLMLSADGRAIPLAPKAFEMLLFLVESRGELLAKNTLMKAVWPNIVVEENSLNQTVSAIRRSLGERPGEHRFIVTEPGRGYRFVADVRVAPATMNTESLPASLPTATRKSIAVLPFANLTGDPTKDYFGDGMAEELIHTLARIPGLKVPSRTSSFSYKGRSVDVRQIARDLEVGVVLEGSVRSAGERIRVTAQLIDGGNGFHLWSQQYDRDFGDLFKLQDELAHAIVATLRLTLDNEAADGALLEPPTRDLEAYHLYLQAMSLQTRLSPYEGIPRVIALLERVIKQDPNFGRAHSAIASLRATAIALDMALPGSLVDSEREVKRCLAMDSNIGSTHAALGIIYAAQGKWLDAQERFRDGLALEPADPLIQQGYAMYLLGSVGLLRAYANTSLAAQRLAPALIAPVLNLAVANTLLHQTEAAHRYAELAVELGVPRFGAVLQDVLALIAMREGRFDEAAELAVSGLPPDIAADGGDEIVRQVYAALGNSAGFSRPIAALDTLRARGARVEMSQFMKRRLMLWYVQLGALDQAFEVATQSLEYFARSGSIGTAWAFLWMPEMSPFRQDARFQLMCQRMGLIDYWQAYGPPDNCELRGGTLICG